MADPPPAPQELPAAPSSSSMSSATSTRGGSDTSSLKPPPPLNFSRPRPTSTASKQRIYPDSGSTTHAINAFVQRPGSRDDDDLPDEPRMSIDTTSSQSLTTPRSMASDVFLWDGQAGELRSRRRPDEYDRNQRFISQNPHPPLRSAISGSTTSSGNNVESPATSERPLLNTARTMTSDSAALPPVVPKKMSRILKRASVTPSLNPTSSGQQEWEDTRSHHTVSDDGSSVAQDVISEEGTQHPHLSSLKEGWASSTFDTSQLTPAEMAKLKKKGINPALYLEMKSARKGKGKWVGPLVGNTYIG